MNLFGVLNSFFLQGMKVVVLSNYVATKIKLIDIIQPFEVMMRTDNNMRVK